MLPGLKKLSDSGDYQEALRTVFALSLNIGLPLYLLSLVFDEFSVDAVFWRSVVQAVAFIFFGICALCAALIVLHRFHLRRQKKRVPPLFDEREQNVLLQAQAGAFWCLLSVLIMEFLLGIVMADESYMESALGMITMGVVAVCVIWVILEEQHKRAEHAE